MKTINYGWVIVGVGLLVKMTGLGFGRFAYSMVLPSMRESLRFNYIQMGLLSGAILLGYLLFSLISGLLATRFGAKKIVIASLLCGSISMFFISRLSGFIPLLFFTFAMGGGGRRGPYYDDHTSDGLVWKAITGQGFGGSHRRHRTGCGCNWPFDPATPFFFWKRWMERILDAHGIHDVHRFCDVFYSVKREIESSQSLSFQIQ